MKTNHLVRHISIFLFIVCALVLPSGFAQPENELDESGDTAPAFALKGPERFKFDGYPDKLVLGDFNGDGRQDFVVYDSNRSLLIMLYSEEDSERKPVEFRITGQEDWAWRPTELVLSASVSSLEVGDLNGDGRADLALANSQDRGYIYLQAEEGLSETPIRLDEKAKRLLVADLDADGHDDLLLLRDESFLVMLQDEEGNLTKGSRMSSSTSPAGQPVLLNFDGDQRRDLAFTDSRNRGRLIVRLGLANGAFGPEMPFEIDDNMGIVEAGHGNLAFLEPNTRALRILGLAEQEKETLETRADVASAVIIPLPPEVTTGRKDAASFRLPSGRLGALVTLSGAADVFILLPGENDQLTANSIPSLAGIAEIAILDHAAKSVEALLLSTGERIVARLDLSTQESMERFPTPLELQEDALALAAGIEGGRQAIYVAYYPENDEDEGVAVGVFFGDDQGFAKEYEVLLEDTEEFEPSHLRVGDLNDDGSSDFLIFFEFEDPRLYMSNGDGTFRWVEAEAGLLRGLMDELNPRDLLLADADQDGQIELLVAREKFLRLYSVSPENGALSIEAQMNPPNMGARLTTPVLADLNGDGKLDVVAVDEETKRLVAFYAAADGGFEDGRVADLPDMTPVKMLTGDYSGDGRDDLLILGEKVLAFLRGGGRSYKVETLNTHLTDVENGLYGRLFSAPFAAEAAAVPPVMLFPVEARENMLELISVEPDGQLESAYRFKVFSQQRQFDESQLRRMNVEPHSLRTGDIDGNGLIDLVILAHQNLIVYTQEAREANLSTAD